MEHESGQERSGTKEKLLRELGRDGNDSWRGMFAPEVNICSQARRMSKHSCDAGSSQFMEDKIRSFRLD